MKALLLGAGLAALVMGSTASAMQAQQDLKPSARPAPAAPAARPAPTARPDGGGFRGGGRPDFGARSGGSPGAGQPRPDFAGRGAGARPDFGSRGPSVGVTPGASAQVVPGGQPSLAGRPDGFRGGRFNGQDRPGQGPGGQGFGGQGFGGQGFGRQGPGGQGFAGRGQGATPQVGAAPGVAAPNTFDRGSRGGDRQGFRGDAGRPGFDRNGDGRVDQTDRRFGDGGRQGFDRNGDGRVDQTDRRFGGNRTGVYHPGDDRTGFRFNGDRDRYGDRSGGRDGRYGRAGGGRAFTYNGSRHNAFRVRPYAFPRGYGYHRYGRGYRLPFAFLAPSYFLYDYSSFYLSAPPSDIYRWVRYGPDALLVDTRTGEVIDAAYGVFYDGSAEAGAYGYEDGYDGSDGQSAYDPDASDGGAYDQNAYDPNGYRQPGPPDGYGDAPR